MKKKIAGLLLPLLFNFSVAYADDAPGSSSHPIEVMNKGNVDISYMIGYWIGGALGGWNTFGVPVNKTDTYNVNKHVTAVTILSGSCDNIKRELFFGWLCENNDIKTNCVNGQYYNPQQIKSITLDSLNMCSVTCLDGTSTSCQVKTPS